MTFEEFETAVADAVAGLPMPFKDLLEKNQIAVIARAKVPSPVRRRFRNSTVFGIFIGLPYGRFANIQEEPTRIELYKDSFDTFNDEAAVLLEIRRTVIHEVAHYFGFSEARIRKLGY
jgi:predicted Zn-dependent protease with MMP-like domain